ncbi:MAG: hypothetical protein EKK46_15430 [Rhodocyclaceae bacterium]|nr:MAG: hypothetical protein EKK46_15430 [Rhodocyclaceae bacterium]
MPSPVNARQPPRLTLLIPGLLWPNPALQDTVFDLPLPALQKLLGRSRIERRTMDEAAWWNTLLDAPLSPLTRGAGGVAMSSPERQSPFNPGHESGLPAAPLRLLGLDVAPGDDVWLCADPVHLRFDQQTLLLDDPDSLMLSDAECAALVAELAPLLAEFGELHVTANKRWHLRLKVAAPPTPALLTDLIGQPAQALLPEGAEHRPWRRLFNEVQMALHQHPVNLAREAAGQPVVNSLALWGAGRLPQPAHGAAAAGFNSIASDQPFHRGLARHLGLTAESATEGYAPYPGHRLAVCPQLLVPTRFRDAMGWREGLKALEQQWFAPALAALGQGRLQSLHLVGFGVDDHRPTCLTASTTRGDNWKFWLGPRPLTELHP